MRSFEDDEQITSCFADKEIQYHLHGNARDKQRVGV